MSAVVRPVPIGRMGPAACAISPLKNTGNIDIFEQIEPLRPIRTSGWIFSVSIESERGLYFLVLTRFLNANRYPLRWKTL
jgi:hypothetical protein